jgi:hypothetical protein
LLPGVGEEVGAKALFVCVDGLVVVVLVAAGVVTSPNDRQVQMSRLAHYKHEQAISFESVVYMVPSQVALPVSPEVNV